MMEFLKHLDQELFLFLNGLHNPFLDTIMYYVTDSQFWYPFFGLIIIFLVWKLKWKALPIILVTFAIVGLSDWLASGVMKPMIQRLRPCADPAIMDKVHLVHGCGRKYGFVSSHGSTLFGMSTFLWITLRKNIQSIGWLFLWSAFVCYSRIYVGKHYPGDILGGVVVGVICALFFYWIFTRINEKLSDKFRLASFR